MDYIGRTMNICLILSMIFITGSHCQYFSNRDIILTPHHLKTYPGKVLYYRPREQVPSDEKPNANDGSSNAAVPWEEVLKETVFLALNDNKTSLQQQSSDSTENAPLLATNRLQKAIYNAPYIGTVDLSVPRFGDIVELAHGRLEQGVDDSYFFVQQDGDNGKPQDSARNVTAQWKVERIRHRDDLRGHRYELKFTVAPSSKLSPTTTPTTSSETANDATPLEGEQDLRDAAPSDNRTYIIRDEDYPKYFGPLLNSPNAVTMHRKNDQMFDRTFFDMVQSQAHAPQQHHHHQFGSFAPATRYYRPAVAPQAQATMTVGQYLLQSLLSGGETPKYHHHHHHFVPGKLAANPAYYGGLTAAATSNRIKFPDSFTGSSHSVPKFYHHIHLQRPSIAPLAPTALPGSYLFHHSKDSHASAPSNIHQDYAKLVDQRGATAPAGHESVETKPTKANTVQQKPSTASLNLVQQQTPFQAQKTSPKPQQFPTQQQQQQFHQQVATIATGTGPQQQTGPQAPTNSQQFPPLQQQQQQPHVNYRQQVSPQQQQPPILIHPHAHPQMGPGGPPSGFFPPSHIIQSIPFYNPQGQMVVNHIPVMSNHHMFQMSPPQPIAIPVHVQLIPPVAPQNHLYAAHQQQQQQQQQPQQQQQQQPLHPHQQDGLQAIPVRIMQPIPNPVHLYSPINPFLPPLQAQQPFHHHQHQHHSNQHHHHHPIVTVTPKTTLSSSFSSSSSSPSTVSYQHHQHHPRPGHAGGSSSNHTTTASHPPTPTSSQNHPPSAHSFNTIPTVFKFTSSNAIPHPQKTTLGGIGGPTTSSSSPNTPHHHHHHRFSTPNVQLSGPSISPTPAPTHHNRHRFSTPGTSGNTGGTRSSPSTATTATAASSSTTPTSATRSSSRYTSSAVGQVSGPTVSSTVANHRYAAPLPTVPASPAGLREKFTSPAFQPQAASESKQSARKAEPPAGTSGVADTVGSPSNAVSPKYESFGVENAVTLAESLLSAVTPTASSLSQLQHTATPTASSASRSTTLSGGSSFSYGNFVDATGAVSVTAKLTSEQTSTSPHHRPGSSSSTASFVPSSAGSTTPISITTQATYVPPPKSYIQQLGPTIGVKFPPAFKSMPSVTILPPQIETPISSTLKTYQYLNHHDTYDFIPSRVVELAHVKKLSGQKHGKRAKSQKGQKMHQKPNGNGTGMGPGAGSHNHHHVTVTSSKPLRFYPGDGPEYATHRPEAQLSVQLPPPEKDYPMTYYGTPKHNQKVQRPKNFVTPLHPYQQQGGAGSSTTTPIPPAAPAVTVPASSAPSVASSVSSPAPPVSTTAAPQQQVTAQAAAPARNVTGSTFRSATASSTAHYYKNRNEKSDDLTTMTITTMRPRVILKTIYRQFPGSFVSTSTSASTEKPVQKWVPKRPRTSTKFTSGEFSTSTLPSSSLPVNAEQAVAASDRAIDVVTKTPVVTVQRSNHDQQMQRVRASRGRSRYTYRRIPSGNPPPMPTGQQQQQQHHTRTSRMRNSNFNASTTTIKPIPSVVTATSALESNRIDERPFEQQERKAEEMVMTTTVKSASNEKIKRDTSEAVEEPADNDRSSAAVAEQLVAQQAENKHDALEVTAPEKEFVMVKASISPPIATNQSNMVFFEASDAVVNSEAPAAPFETGRSIGSAFDELTMSIINHAKAIVNQTEKPASGEVAAVAQVAAGGKSIESNEIAHKDEAELETTVEVTTAAAGSTSSPVTESTVSETIGTTIEDGVDAASTTDDEASQTTVAIDIA